MKQKEMPVEEFLPLALCTAGAAGVFPFAVIRLVQGDWITGAFDFALVCSLVGLGVYLRKSQNIRLVSMLLAAFCVGGMLITIGLRGAEQIMWAYPALLSLFFLLNRQQALIAASLVIAALTYMLFPEVQGLALAKILITLGISGVFAYAFASNSKKQRRKLLVLASEDPLTGAGNRRALAEKLDRLIALRDRTGLSSSMLMLDLDHFKEVNDRFGHAMGDQILIDVTRIIRARIRSTDSVYRIGGEEFVVVAEGESLESAFRLAEQLRTLIEANSLLPEGTVTVSLGVAEHTDGESAMQWCHRADDALYRAKHSGRNMIRLAAA